MLNALALAALLAASPQAAGAPPQKGAAAPPAMTVAVEAAPSSGAAGQQWAGELRTALDARKDEFRAARKGERPELLVKVESVEPATPAQSAAYKMNGALVLDGQTKAFNLSYSGEVRPQAEKLARNLRRFAEQMKAAPPAAKK